MANEPISDKSTGALGLLKAGQRIITLDVVFRGLLGVVFVGMIIAALGMPETSFGKPAAYPMFVGTVGLVLWVLSNINEVLGIRRGREQSRIYDIKFETEGMSQLVVWLRTAWVFGIMGGTIVGVWLVNFHIAIPLFLITYLKFVGKVKWWVALLIALLVEIPIVVLYGAVIHTVWPESVIERIFDFSIQDLLDGPLA